MDEGRLNEAEDVLRECYDRVQQWDYGFLEYPDQGDRVHLACTMARVYAMLPPSVPYQQKQMEELSNNVPASETLEELIKRLGK